MKSWLSLVLLAGLVGGTGLVEAQEAQTIKLKELIAGDSVQIERTETVKVGTLIVDGKGDKQRDTTKTAVETSVFQETIVQRDGNKPPAKVERAYTKAQQTVDGMTKDLPYQGKMIVIEQLGDKYTFTLKGGAELPPASVPLLDEEFNRRGHYKAEHLRRLFPRDAVKVNEPWPLDMAAVLKPLQTSADMGFDVAKASGTGKLTKVYTKDDRTFGELHYVMKIPLTTLGKDKEKLDLLDGSSATFDVSADVCIDGSAHIETRRIKNDLLGKARVPLPAGGMGDLTLTVSSELREVRKELPKK